MTHYILCVIALLAGGFMSWYGQREEDNMTIRFGIILIFLGVVGFLLPFVDMLIDALLDLVL